MKCKCDHCEGSGVAACYECDGEGTLNVSIIDLKPSKSEKHYEALLELHLSAVIAERQALELIKLKPEHTESYNLQLKQTLEQIEREAEELQKKEVA
jgi:hypothetical protein